MCCELTLWEDLDWASLMLQQSQDGALELSDRKGSMDGVRESNRYSPVKVEPQVKCLAH